MGLHNPKQFFLSSKFNSVIDIEFPLQSFREYIKLTDQLIEKEVKTVIETNIKSLTEFNSDDDELLLFDPNDHEIKIHLRQLYYHSLFISLYSLLEKTMWKLCKIAEQGQSLKIRDISGDGIFKYHKYLEKVLKVDLSELNTEWSIIVKYNKLRNQLVHSTNQIEKNTDNNKLLNTLRSLKGLEITDYGDFYEFEINDKTLLLEFNNTVYKFLHGIYWEKH